MNAKRYTIKPLVWKTCRKNGLNSPEAQTIFGEVWVIEMTEGIVWGGDGFRVQSCRSFPDGKRKAEAAYRARLETALEEVKP